MKKVSEMFASTLRFAARPFLGKGYVDRYAPFLIPLFKKTYASLSIPDQTVISIPLGKKLSVHSKDIGVGLPLIMKGAYEPVETKLFLESVHEGDVIADVGANIGYYSILGAEKAGGGGKVYAFEPDAANLPFLKNNIALNKTRTIEIVGKAVANKDGYVYFASNPLSKGDSSIAADSGEGANEKIPCVKLDTYFKDVHVDIVKMDIEGAEIEALEGGRELLGKGNISLFVEYNPSSLAGFGHKPEKLIELVQSFGYDRIVLIDESTGQSYPYSTEQLAQTMKHTTFCNLYCTKSRQREV